MWEGHHGLLLRDDFLFPYAVMSYCFRHISLDALTAATILCAFFPHTMGPRCMRAPVNKSFSLDPDTAARQHVHAH